MPPRPGYRTSEFFVAVLGVLAAIVSAWQDYVSDSNGVKLGFAAAVGYIISRGLAKYEQRGPGSPPAG
jgi:hypothetical protein